MLGRRDGVALALAIFALAAIGVLVSGAFFLGLMDLRMARAELRLEQAVALAEGAAHANLDRLRDEWGRRGAVSDSAGPDVQRLGSRLLLVTGVGRRRPAFRRVGVLVWLKTPPLAVPQAFATHGPLRGRPPLVFPAHDERADCRLPPAPAADDLSGWREIASFVLDDGTVVSPGPSGSCCRSPSPAHDWGDPLARASPSGDRRPVIYVAGDLEIRGGVGQGVLVVAGDLSAGGGFVFHGAVLVGGRLLVGTGGIRIVGAVRVYDARHRGSELVGPTLVFDAPCTVLAAAMAAARPVALAERGWIWVNE